MFDAIELWANLHPFLTCCAVGAGLSILKLVDEAIDSRGAAPTDRDEPV